MTREEAIESLERIREISGLKGCRENIAINMAIEALRHVPDTNVGEISTRQAMDALQMVKEFCRGRSVDECLNGHCPIGAWCFNYRKSEPTPATWKVPQERTEEHD